ncbi:MAG: methyltransferase domain-containing protein, partial [Rickettsiales bacterium]|nr:methyltransferase domain-containing protein [Rickettsiales bacterium]
MATQKPTAKKAPATKSLPNSFMDEARLMGNDWKQKALRFVSQWEKFKDILLNNYELGQQHLRMGNLQDAVMRFRFVLWLDPKYKDAWYYLGCSYMAARNIRAAQKAFQTALKLHPDSDEARYMLAITTGKSMPKAELPKRIPQSLLVEMFETMAPHFNADEVGTFQYEGHTQLANALRSGLTQGRMDHVILDLGVGTGLCGPLLRDVASHITGVDLSPAMLAEAVKVVDERGQKIYDALIRREAMEFISDGPSDSYDIVMAAGLVSYIGDLQPFFEQCAR